MEEEDDEFTYDDYINELKLDLEDTQGKQEALDWFFDTDDFKKLPEGKKNLLQAQFGALLAYSSILIEVLRQEDNEHNLNLN